MNDLPIFTHSDFEDYTTTMGIANPISYVRLDDVILIVNRKLRSWAQELTTINTLRDKTSDAALGYEAKIFALRPVNIKLSPVTDEEIDWLYEHETDSRAINIIKRLRMERAINEKT